MAISIKIFRILVFPVILGILICTFDLSNNSFAQILHDRTLEEVTRQTSGVNKSSQIDVGRSPSNIVISFDKVYVLNYDSNTLSVINKSNNTKIREIPVGDNPSDIDIWLC
jgi:YVTN family beta-propeller protein